MARRFSRESLSYAVKTGALVLPLSFFILVLIVRIGTIRSGRRARTERRRSGSPSSMTDFGRPFDPLAVLEIAEGDGAYVPADSHEMPAGDIMLCPDILPIAQPHLTALIYTFRDYDYGRREKAEEALYSLCLRTLRESAALENAGMTRDARAKLKGFFLGLTVLGNDYSFIANGARDRFVRRLAGHWQRVPHYTEGAAVRLMGLVGGDGAVTALTQACNGPWWQEAALGLLRTGDINVLRRVDGFGELCVGWDECGEVLLKRLYPRSVDYLVAALGSSDESERVFALKLIERLAGASAGAVRDAGADGGEAHVDWYAWWREARSGVESLTAGYCDGVVPEAVRLLPPGGGTALLSEREKALLRCELCRLLFSSYDLKRHRRGETLLYSMMTGRLERAVGEMHETDPATGRLVMMLEETCRLHVFSDTKERSAFLKTADKALRSGVSPEFAERTVRLLGIIGGDEAVPILVPFLEDPSDAVRRAAVVACGRQGDVAMVPRLRSVAANGVSHAEGRTVVEALERIGTPEAETVLAEMVRSARSLTAYDAYLALRRLRNIWGPPCSLEEFERARNLSEYGAPACR